MFNFQLHSAPKSWRSSWHNRFFGRTLALLLLSSLTPASAELVKEVENPASGKQFLQDTWVVEYQADAFTEKMEKVKVLYIPKDMQDEAAFFLRCEPFFTNFSIQYTDWEKNLRENGELPNASAKFAKHGFIYDTEQELEVTVDGDDQEYDISVGGQNKHITKLFKTDQKLQPGQLGMSLFFSFVAAEMPSFRSAETSDEAKDFFKQLNQAINTQKPIQFKLENDRGWQRNFSLDTARMVNAVPQEVLEFCVTKRQIK